MGDSVLVRVEVGLYNTDRGLFGCFQGVFFRPGTLDLPFLFFENVPLNAKNPLSGCLKESLQYVIYTVKSALRARNRRFLALIC